MRLVTFFIGTFVLLTLADAVTTRLGIQAGHSELNPYSDTRSLWTLLRPELLIAVIGTASVALGSFLLHRNALLTSARDSQTFRTQFWQASNLPCAILVFLPMAIAVGRLLPVTSNLLLLTFGYSPWISFIHKVSRLVDLPLHNTMFLVQGVLFGLLAMPLTELIRRLMRTGSNVQ
ncbi:hypothetical protein FEM03_18445 [Phragmitibacter flavus]|uniref:Uncharacterized protein n=1 Tax=Phragmitibacter flavus TaxID=2576071 RepID=A0A5R8KCN2_9BACT|nr:hypothetical protein [Phragmitibacter flavus]TLD69349.1 hypothetical protein FEM03_18445 [Phragmitibacter flavus]